MPNSHLFCSNDSDGELLYCSTVWARVFVSPSHLSLPGCKLFPFFYGVAALPVYHLLYLLRSTVQARSGSSYGEEESWRGQGQQ